MREEGKKENEEIVAALLCVSLSISFLFFFFFFFLFKYRRSKALAAGVKVVCDEVPFQVHVFQV